MKRILPDTNAYSGYLMGDEQVLHALSKAEVVYMSVFVLGELLAGFKGGSRERWNKELLYAFLSKPTVVVLNATSETSEIFADVMFNLKKSGKPIPMNDAWIASHSLETGSVLITCDKRFKAVPGLRLWYYVE